MSTVVNSGYTRPKRPTEERVEYTWRDRCVIQQRRDVVDFLRSDPGVVIGLSRKSLDERLYSQRFVDFWGSMILNRDIAGLIEYHQSDLPIDWFHGHPVVWPGKYG